MTAVAITGCQRKEKDSAQPAVKVAATSSAPSLNGVEALAADDILDRAKAALTKVKSFRAKGAMLDDGQQTDLDLKISGSDFVGSMSFADAKVELLAVDGTDYLRPNEGFLVSATNDKQGKAMAKLVGNRWMAGIDDDKSFTGLFSIGTVDGLLKPSGELSKGETKEIGGAPAIGLKDSGDPDSVLYIATTGEPYPLEMVGKDGSTVVFSAFGEPFADIAKPAEDDIVDFGKLTDETSEN